jgi:hypothetical protein
LKGFLESIAADQIRGWAYDPDHPDAHLIVSIYADGKKLGTTVASGQRHDLQSAGIGRGDHGFAIEFAPELAAELLPSIEAIANSDAGQVTLIRASPPLEVTLNAASNSRIPVVDDQQFPVFILGPARSGTSALALALLKTRRYEGFGEGHLLPLALELLQTAHKHYDAYAAREKEDTFIRKVPVRTFERMVRRSFIQLTRTAFPTGFWIDKTPTIEMVRAAPLMREIWPNARFIFIKRRVIENVISRLRKFPQDSLEEHYMDWHGVMQAWLDVRHALKDVSIEVDHLDLARMPADVSSKLSGFLGLTGDQAQKLADSLAGDRPEQTSDNFAAVHTLEDLNLADEERERLINQCNPVMAALGYDYSANYFSRS